MTFGFELILSRRTSLYIKFPSGKRDFYWQSSISKSLNNMDLNANDEDGVQPQKPPFQIDLLPEPALRHLFKFLDWKDQKCLRQLCKGVQRFIDHEYGLHAYFPTRYSHFPQMSTLHPGRMCWKPITDRMWTQAIQVLEGKVIRSLEMNEMHPDLNPFPIDRIIRYPWGLLRVSLNYVDVGLVIALLSSCRNLSEFHYTSGVQVFFEGPKPAPIPMEGKQLIQFVTRIPHLTFQVDKLTLLSLRLEKVNLELHIDWANVLFLLLALSQRSLGSLRTFKFDFATGDCLNSRDRLEILACVGQFLATCHNLRKLEYSSGMWTESLNCSTLPNGVFSGFIKHYGSAQLKEMHLAGGLGSVVREKALEQARQIMTSAGMNLRNLQDIHFHWCSRLEPELFQLLLRALPSPSMREIDIQDQIGYFINNGSYDLLLGQRQGQSGLPLYGNLQKLCVRQSHLCYSLVGEDDNPNGALSLPRMLNMMRNLKHLEFIPCKSYPRGLEPGYYHWYVQRIDLETADVTFEDIAVHFQALKVLKMEGVKISSRDAGRLVQLRNLEELVLKVIPKCRHQLFGIKSADLIRIVRRLRKLDKLEVNMIEFPVDDSLKSVHSAALQGIGKLAQTHPIVGARRDADVGCSIIQYFTFEFGKDADGE